MKNRIIVLAIIGLLFAAATRKHRVATHRIGL
jgi:hypothetical protein